MDAVVESAASGACLRVEFHRHGDRFWHTIRLADRGDSLPLLVSSEGGESEDWPASPPLAQLAVEEQEGGRVAMLVGMAGRSHWSASVEPVAAGGGIAIDVACRAADPLGFLGSTYNVAAPWVAADDHGGLSLRHNDHRHFVRIEVESGEATLEQNALLVIRPALDNAGRTFRWRYVVRLEAREPPSSSDLSPSAFSFNPLPQAREPPSNADPSPPATG